MKPVKALALLAVVLGTSGVVFQLFLNNSTDKLNSVLNIGGSFVELGGGLFIILALGFLYHFFR